jgi:uncharacterized membrane protein YdjX (TVP38/TMEM64 family)
VPPADHLDDVAATEPAHVVPVGRHPRLRLALLVAGLATGILLFAVLGVVSVADVRDGIEGLGPAAPLAFVVVSAVLAALLVPGPLLAAASGLLFGPVLGTVVSLAAAVGTSVIALRLGRAAGRDGARAVLGPRRAALSEALLERRGLVAVVGQRLLPLTPDAPLSYAFGALGVRTWQIALGTVLGAAPRAFAYTALGASIDDPSSPLALAGIGAWVVVTVAGAEIGRRWWRARRRRPAGPAEPEPEPDGA